MTLVFAYNTPSDSDLSVSSLGAYIGGDTISEHSQKPASLFIKTSQGENFTPATNGEIKYYQEDSCKVGALNNNTLFAASGDSLLIGAVVRHLVQQYDEINDVVQIRDYYDSACISLSPLADITDSKAELLFLIHINGYVRFSKIIFTVDGNGQLAMPYGDWKFATKDKSAVFAGSGTSLLEPVAFSFHGEIQRNPSMLGFMHQAIVTEFSNEIRRVTGGQASYGVGGSFLTIGVNESGTNYPPDCVYLSADDADTVQSITKVIYREGLFYIMDFIEDRLRIVPTLDTKAKYSKGETRKDEYEREARSFQSPVLVLLRRAVKGIYIQKNMDGQVLRGGAPGLDITFVKGAELELSFSHPNGRSKNTIKLQVRN